MNITCPSCKTDRLFIVGNVPQWDIFAGNKIGMQLQTYLYKCRECNLFFKYPRLSKEQLDELYKNGDPEYWQSSLKNRQDWQIAIKFISKNISKGTILDIGCWDGEFLCNMKAGWKCCGTEINPVALKIAEDKGIEITADNFDDLVSQHVKYDIVTAFNMLEHTEDPFNFIKIMSNLTKENGFIIISSGNTGSLTWKISSGRYWYCAIPEHLSFINISWIQSSAKKLNLGIERIEKFSSTGENSKSQFLMQSIKNVTYLISPGLFKKLKKLKHHYSREKNINNLDRYPPHWGTSRDHLIVIFRKK